MVHPYAIPSPAPSSRRMNNNNGRGIPSAVRRTLTILVIAMVLASVAIVILGAVYESKSYSLRKQEADAQSDDADAASKVAAQQLQYNNKNYKHAPATAGCEATVMILRHCEKSVLLDESSQRQHCNYIGYRRAQYLATLFGDPSTHRWPPPSQLYAMSPNRSKHVTNVREAETLQPISHTFRDMSISTEYSDNQELARHIFSNLHAHCGNLVLVSWRHSDIPLLAQQLGCGPNDGCPSTYHSLDYDSVWQLTFLYQPQDHYWSVYGTVVPAMFDPLHYSHLNGHYSALPFTTDDPHRNASDTKN